LPAAKIYRRLLMRAVRLCCIVGQLGKLRAGWQPAPWTVKGPAFHRQFLSDKQHHQWSDLIRDSRRNDPQVSGVSGFLTGWYSISSRVTAFILFQIQPLNWM
jgi:hypothetical protein